MYSVHVGLSLSFQGEQHSLMYKLCILYINFLNVYPHWYFLVVCNGNRNWNNKGNEWKCVQPGIVPGSPQSLPHKGPSNSAEWRGWFSGLVVRHLTSNQETGVWFPAEHIFTYFLRCFDFCSHYTLLINICQKSLWIAFRRE